MPTKRRLLLTMIIFNFCYAWILNSSLFPMTSTVSGKVIDEETQKGIPGVAVNIFYGQYGDQCETNQNGEFSFYEVDPGDISVAFIPPPPYALPFVDEMKMNYKVLYGKNLHIFKKLGYGGTIVGRVFDRNTNKSLTISDVWVFRHIPTTVKTNDNGEFRIDQLKPGSHILKLIVPGFGPREIKDIKIQSKEIKRIDFPFDSTSSTKITGKITCETGPGSFSNKEVDLFPTSGDLNSHTYTDIDGDYAFNDIEPGEYKIVVAGVKEGEKPEQIKFMKTIWVFEGKTFIINIKVDCSLNYSFFCGE